MYAWIWRQLPGPLPARLALAAALIGAALAVLWLVAFPWLHGLVDAPTV